MLEKNTCELFLCRKMKYIFLRWECNNLQHSERLCVGADSSPAIMGIATIYWAPRMCPSFYIYFSLIITGTALHLVHKRRLCFPLRHEKGPLFPIVCSCTSVCISKSHLGVPWLLCTSDTLMQRRVRNQCGEMKLDSYYPQKTNLQVHYISEWDENVSEYLRIWVWKYFKREKEMY